MEEYEGWPKDRVDRLLNAKTNAEFDEVLLECGTVNCNTLKELFPQHGDEIDELSSHSACGCSMCVMRTLGPKYNLKMPEKYRGAIWS